MIIPQGYKQTELGIIPEDWEVVTVDDVLDMPTKTTSTTSFFSKYYVGTENMYSFKRGIAPYRGYLSYMLVREYKPNDILTSNIRPYLKKIWLANRYGGCSSDVIVFRVKDAKTYSAAYIYTILSDDAFFKYSMDSAIGTKMPRGDKSAIKVYTFAIPKDIAEQRAIAETLSDVDGLIAALDKKIAKKRLLKQGAMQQLLTGKKRLPGFTDEWVEKKLGEISHITTGKKDVNEGCEHGKYPFFTCSTSIARSDSYSFDKEAILIAGNGDVGNMHYYNGKFEAYQRTYVLSEFKIDTFYVLQYMDAFLISTLNDGKVGSTIPYIVLGQLQDFVIKTPKAIKEQQAIATILSDMDKEIADLEAQRDKYRLLKSGMMQKLLTGQIRLKTE